jgi:hypothetical protein
MQRADYVTHDFGEAGAYFSGEGTSEWADLAAILDELAPHFQASDQAGRQGTPIFDPKGTNAARPHAHAGDPDLRAGGLKAAANASRHDTIALLLIPF